MPRGDIALSVAPAALAPPPAADHLLVRLVSRVDGGMTGISRYAAKLRQHLVGRGVPTVMAGGVGGPPLPRIARQAALRLGFDVEAFFTTYPLWLPRGPRGCVTHLTGQNQASAVAFWGQPRLLVTVHDLITLAHRQRPELAGYMTFYDRLFDNLIAPGLRRADLIAADSEQSRRDVIEFVGVPAERVRVVHLGVDHETFYRRAVPAEFLERHRLERARPYILYVGSEDPRKNLRRLLDAVGKVAQCFPDVQLLKVGAARFGAERQRLLAYVRERGLQPHVRFYDRVSDQELALFYNLATVFAFPSLYEGFGLPALEAMACGLPVVASNVSSVPEVVGDAGIQVDPYRVDDLAEALLAALGDGGLRARLRQRGLARAAEFTWERTAEETLRLYHELAG